jgi:hypothetical protein
MNNPYLNAIVKEIYAPAINKLLRDESTLIRYIARHMIKLPGLNKTIRGPWKVSNMLPYQKPVTEIQDATIYEIPIHHRSK